MLPTLDSLQKLAAEACRTSNVCVCGRPDADALEADIQAAYVITLRQSIYSSLQQLVKPGMRVLIDGLTSKPNLNLTTGSALFWSEEHQRWAVQPGI